MNNTVLKNNEDFLAHYFKTLMCDFISRHDRYLKATDAIVNIEQCMAYPDVLDEDKWDRRESSKYRRGNKDRRNSTEVNNNGHARRHTIDRRQVFKDRRGVIG